MKNFKGGSLNDDKAMTSSELGFLLASGEISSKDVQKNKPSEIRLSQIYLDTLLMLEGCFYWNKPSTTLPLLKDETYENIPC